MKFCFRSIIYKAGINPCVTVSQRVSAELEATKGYIPVKGTINGFFFQQTLCPIKGEGYRLYVNGIMLKGSGLKVGQMANFTIEQDTLERNKNVPMLPAFKKKLEEHKLLAAFLQLSPSRQKEVNRYLNHLKTAEALEKNIDKMIKSLRGKVVSSLLPRK